QTLGDCLRLLCEASGEHQAARQKLVEKSREAVSLRDEASSVKLAQCVVVLCVEVVEEQESVTLEHYWQLDPLDIDDRIAYWLRQQIEKVVSSITMTDWEPQTVADFLGRACRRLTALLELAGDEAGT